MNRKITVIAAYIALICLLASCNNGTPAVTEDITDGITTVAPVTDPVTEAPKTEPVTDPVTEAPKTEPITEAPKTEPITDPITEAPKTEPVTEPKTEPVTEDPTEQGILEALDATGYTLKGVRGKNKNYDEKLEPYIDKYVADITVYAPHSFVVEKYRFSDKYEVDYGVFTLENGEKTLLRLPLFDVEALNVLNVVYGGVENAYLYPKSNRPNYWSDNGGTETTENGMRTWRSEPSEKISENGFTYTYCRINREVPVGMRSYAWLAYYEYSFEKYPKEYEAVVKSLEKGVTVTCVFEEVKLPVDMDVTEADFDYIVNPDGSATILKYVGAPKRVIIPETIDGHPVTVLGEDAFREWNSYLVEEVAIPATVKRIEKRCFYYCKNLKNIHISEGVEYIGEYAFDYCAFKNVKIPDSVTFIGNNAFAKTAEVELGSGFSELTYAAGKVYKSVIKSPVPLSGKKIEYGYKPNETEYIFEEFTGVWADLSPAVVARFPEGADIEKVDISGGGDVFLPASELESFFCSSWEVDVLTLTGTAEAIPEYAFCGAKIGTLILPEGITTLCEGAFKDASIGTLILPSTVKKIEKYAFLGFEGDLDIVKGAKLTELSSLACLEGRMSANMQDSAKLAKITDREADERIYLGDDGYYHVKGSDTVRFPADGVYLAYEDERGIRFYASRSEVEPAYEAPEEKGGFYVNSEGKLCLSYGDGSPDLVLDKSMNWQKNPFVEEGIEIGEVWTERVSYSTSYCVVDCIDNTAGKGYITSKGIIVHNGGELCIGTSPSIKFVSDLVGFYNTGVTYAAGMRIVNLVITVDGGLTFESNVNLNHCVKRPSDNAVIAINLPTVLDEARYMNYGFFEGEGFEYMTRVYPENFYEAEHILRTDNGKNRFTMDKVYFDGDIGFCRRKCTFESQRDESGEFIGFYVYFISFDGGMSWQIFDPADADAEVREIKVYGNKSERVFEGRTFTFDGDEVTVEGVENVVLDRLAWYSGNARYENGKSVYANLFNAMLGFEDNTGVPLYRGITGSAHKLSSVWENGRKHNYLSYNNYSKIVELPNEVKSESGEVLAFDLYYNRRFDYYVSEPLTWLFDGRALIISRDMGDTFLTRVFDYEIDNVTWYGENELSVVCFKTAEDKSKEYYEYYSTDGGKTFSLLDKTERGGSYGMVFGGVEYRVITEFIDNGVGYRHTVTAFIDGKKTDGGFTVSSRLFESGVSMPYFTGDFGIWSFNSYAGLETVYMTFDGGKTWHNYSEATHMSEVWYDSPTYSTPK